MAKSEVSQTAATAPAKRRWYHNLLDAYKITKRSFPQLPWWLLLATVAVVGSVATLNYFLGAHWILNLFFSLTFLFLTPTVILGWLVKKALYRQIDGHTGAVYGVISQIRSGWTVEKQPIAANRQQDLVWRMFGRPGVVLLAEGPKSRVRELVERERKQIQRVVSNVPVHTIYVGHDEGQVPLEKVEKTLRKLPKSLRRDEVPLVVNRLQALSNVKLQGGLPHSVDPAKARAKVSRRAFRGR
ncbi:DUF4191 domain-containing protein [Gleimia sp. 6138-11-ORH1]|uniref:DUF4191 domain-containing protein n=1 Tax=Gleimia sp. 6138-11-ORH1 TaxID=2973937 RepID=UPI002168F29A|nr:DUF4191 domain-containing protein [Gleimia sp. 6138-11-ORH1]MCS4484262.1 DUF4191 domain-containing protein [Gleimia sp. 6138-11-ORH1]